MNNAKSLHNGNPCEILARIGFEALAKMAEPTSADDGDSSHEDHARVATLLRQAEARENQYGSVFWLGRKISWPERLPELVTWSGRQTLGKLIKKYQSALSVRVENLFTFTAALKGASGLDPLINLDPIDVGFSANGVGIEVQQRPAVELLAIYALDFTPVLSFGGGEYAIMEDMIEWRFGAEKRAGGYYSRWTFAQGRELTWR